MKILCISVVIIDICSLFADSDSDLNLPVKEIASRVDNYGDSLPRDAVRRMGTVRLRWGRGDSCDIFAYSPDGKSIAVQNTSNCLRIWNIANGKELIRFKMSNSLLTLAYSSDGKMLAGSYDCVDGYEVDLLDTKTGKCIRKLEGSGKPVESLVFSKDGKTLITGGKDRFIRFLDVDTGKEKESVIDVDAVNILTLSKDGNLLASASRDESNKVSLWSVKERGLLKVLEFDGNDLRRLSFSPDANRLACATKSGFFVWDVNKAKIVQKFDEIVGTKSHIVDNCNNIAYSSDGRWLAIQTDFGTISLINSETGKEIRQWKTGTPSQDLVFSKDDKSITTKSPFESTIRVWDVETGKEVLPCASHRGTIYELRLSTDAKALWSSASDQSVLCWNIASAKLEKKVSLPPEPVISNLSPNGTGVAWCSIVENKIHYMDLKSGKETTTPYNGESYIDSLRFSPDGKSLLLICHRAVSYIWKWETDSNPKSLENPFKDVELITFTNDGENIVSASKGANEIYGWNIKDRKKTWSVSFNFPIEFSKILVSPDGKWLVTKEYRHGYLSVIKIDDSKIIRKIKIDKKNACLSMNFSPNGQILAVGDKNLNNSLVSLIEFASGETIAKWDGHHDEVTALEFSVDNRTLYSGSGDSTILQWDATARHGKTSAAPNLQEAWDTLDKAASKSYPAIWDFVDAPKEAVSMLRKKLIPTKVDAQEYQRLVDDLDAKAFRTREKASDALKTMGYSIELFLQQTLKVEKRPEVKERIGKLVDELGGTSWLRMQRAMQILRTINSEESRKILVELSKGSPESMLTKEATAVLGQMQ